MTNYQKFIDLMNKDRAAKMITKTYGCRHCPARKNCRSYLTCEENILQFLGEEYHVDNDLWDF